MPRFASNRLVHQLQRVVADKAYTDMAYYYPAPSAVPPLDDLGQPIPVTTGTKVVCNFSDSIRNRQAIESWRTEGDIGIVDAEIRFPQGLVTPTKGGKFKLTQKWDDPGFVDSTFEIIGIRYRGVFGYVCALRRIEI